MAPSSGKFRISFFFWATTVTTFLIFLNAAYTGKRALAICSISDNLITGEELTPEERQTTFTNMMKIALEDCHKNNFMTYFYGNPIS